MATGALVVGAADNTAPTTTKTVGMPKFGTDDFYVTSATQFTLSCADNSGGTGCNGTFYQIVGASDSCPSNANEALWTSYSGPFSLPADGEARLCYFSKDVAGNRETPKFQNHFRDNSAPTTTATGTSGMNAYLSGTWTNQNVSVALNATDAAGSGVKEITYSASGATTIASTTVAGASVTGLTFSNEGETTLTFFAKDNLDNTETSKTFIIRIDKTAPVIVQHDFSPAANADGWHNSDITVRFKVTDALSGADATCQIAFPDVVADGRLQSKVISTEGNAVTVDSDPCTDVAGNSAAAKTSDTFKLDKTAPTITDVGPTTLPNAFGWYNTDVVFGTTFCCGRCGPRPRPGRSRDAPQRSYMSPCSRR
jgi:hypothetical protein